MIVGLIVTVHIIACILLIVIILIQSGRGGGLIDSLSGVESMFGTKTNALLSKVTTVLSTIFIITCLTLAVLAARQGRSLVQNALPVVPAATTEAAPVQAPATESAKKDLTKEEPVQASAEKSKEPVAK